MFALIFNKTFELYQFCLTRGEVGGDKGGKEGRVFRTTIKNTWTKPRWGGSKRGRWEWLGWWVSSGG